MTAIGSGRATAAGHAWRLLPLWALLLLLTLILARSHPIDSDEGYTLNAAWQLWNGLRMYDDFRLFVGPGSGYAVFWLWKLIGGTSHVAARLLAVGFFYSSGIALYLVLRRLAASGVASAVAVVGWLFLASFYVPLNHNSFSSYAAVWLLVPFMRLVPRGGDALTPPRVASTAVPAGVAAGVVFVILPVKGTLLVLAACAWLAISLRRRAIRSASIFVATFAIVAILPLVLRWRLPTLIEQWLVIPLRGHYLGHTGASRSYVVLAGVILVGMTWTAARLRDRWMKALAMFQAALFISMGHNMELGHFAINAFPTIVFVTLVAQQLLAGTRRLRTFAVAATLAVGGTIGVWIAVMPAGHAFLSRSTLAVDLLARPRKLFANPRVAAARAIYAGPFLPGLYYLLGKPNPYFVSETVVCDDACQRRLVAELRAVRPDLAFLNYAMIGHLSYDQSAPADVFVREHYVRCADQGFFQVLALDPHGCP